MRRGVGERGHASLLLRRLLHVVVRTGWSSTPTRCIPRTARRARSDAFQSLGSCWRRLRLVVEGGDTAFGLRGRLERHQRWHRGNADMQRTDGMTFPERGDRPASNPRHRGRCEGCIWRDGWRRGVVRSYSIFAMNDWPEAQRHMRCDRRMRARRRIKTFIKLPAGFVRIPLRRMIEASIGVNAIQLTQLLPRPCGRWTKMLNIASRLSHKESSCSSRTHRDARGQELRRPEFRSKHLRDIQES